MDLTIVIPARDEEENILETLAQLTARVKAPHRIIVVNDHSSDKTADCVREFARIHPNVSLIDNSGLPGFSNAVKTGFNAVKSGAIVTVMADHCDKPETIDAMFSKIQEGYDVVCGSRYMPGGEKLGGRFLQSLFSRFVGKSLRLLARIPTHDVSNAFKMYRKEVLDVVTIKEKGFAMSMEIVVNALFLGFKIAEVPTSWKDRTAGKSHFRIFRVGRHYLRLYLLALFLMMKSMLIKSGRNKGQGHNGH